MSRHGEKRWRRGFHQPLSNSRLPRFSSLVGMLASREQFPLEENAASIEIAERAVGLFAGAVEANFPHQYLPLQIHFAFCMLICMKPTRKQLDDLQAKIVAAYAETGLSNAEIGRISTVHPSQVGRICEGGFKTFSHNVVQVCKALGVIVPRLEPRKGETNPDWARAQSSMRKIWDQTPEGARTIARMLDAIADLKAARKDD